MVDAPFPKVFSYEDLIKVCNCRLSNVGIPEKKSVGGVRVNQKGAGKCLIKSGNKIGLGRVLG